MTTRQELEQAINDSWHMPDIGTDDPDFWLRHAEHHETLVDLYRQLLGTVDQDWLRSVLIDAEHNRREKAAYARAQMQRPA